MRIYPKPFQDIVPHPPRERSRQNSPLASEAPPVVAAVARTAPQSQVHPALDQAGSFLEALLRPATPDSYLEIRPLPDAEHQYRAWHRVGDLRSKGFQTALPAHLDGQTNVYYGVCPRAVQGGTRADVSQATAVWFDEITRPAPDLPPFSWLIETSPGKVQGGYFLKEASRNLDRVERLAKRLAVYVGGDNVHDRARILRLPGFINAKYPDGPRSFLLEFHPDLRYSLEELEQIIPLVEGDNGDQRISHHDGPFQPHKGRPLPAEGQEGLARKIHEWGLDRHSDGRYVGPCPMAHSNGPSDGNSFYVSPLTGSWSCFGSSHQGPRHGGVGALIPGIDDQRWKTAYVAASDSFYKKGADRPRQLDRTQVVPGIVYRTPGIHYARDKSALWEHVKKELFPLGGKPWLYGAVLENPDTGKSQWVNFIGTTWLFGPNAQHKRACIFFNLFPRINGRQLYELSVAIDDWNLKVHERETKRISRAIAKADDAKLGWCRFDNAVARGYMRYLTNVPDLPGFEPVQDVGATLVDALKAITPPPSGEPGRFRPYTGSDNWTARLETTGQEDQDRWNVLAVSNKPVDHTQVEAECVASHRPYEFTKEHWRSQVGRGLLTGMSPEESVEVALGMGYQLTKHGRAVGSRMSADGSQRAEDAPHEWGWSAPPDGDGPVIVEVII